MEHKKEEYFKTADGAVLRYTFWKAKKQTNYPQVIILQGRATTIEKIAHFVERVSDAGYDVWTFEWRGQGLSTRLAGRRGYIDTYNTYLNDLHYFLVSHVKAAPLDQKPLMVLGHSMGAHIGLRYMAEHPGMIDAALMASPMLDLNTGIYPKNFAHRMCRLLSKMGFGKSYVFGHGDYDPATEPFEGNLLTHNQEMFHYHRRLQMERPELILGGVTFQWVSATMDSIQLMLQESYLRNIKVPVHIVAAEEEKVVDNSRLQQACEWMNSCSVEVIKGARHQLLAETPHVQERLIQSLDELRTHYLQGPAGDPSPPTTSGSRGKKSVSRFDHSFA